jgi:hypothetical protein
VTTEPPVVTAPPSPRPSPAGAWVPAAVVGGMMLLALWMVVLTAWFLALPAPSSPPTVPAAKPDPVAEAAAAYIRAVPDGYGAAAVAASKGASSAEAYQALTDTLKLPEEALAGALAKETDFAGALARARAAMKAALR